MTNNQLTDEEVAMKYRRTIFAYTLAVVLFSWPPTAWSQPTAQPQVKVEPLQRAAIEAAPGHELNVSRLEVPPGYVSASHSHAGETFVYILSGRILNQIGDEEPKVYEAGQFFFEHANANHARFENPDAQVPAVVLIYGIRPVTAN
jgi:quercetin dioxygenase-like cupin family protein